MIELTNSAAITLAVGATAVFDSVFYKTCKDCTTCSRNGTGVIKMCCSGAYEIRFTGNIGVSGATGLAQLNIAIDGTNYPQGLINSETSTEGDLNSVERTFVIPNCKYDCARVSVVNTGTVPVTIGVGAILSVKKVCA